ncbi:MAG TPA: C2H2-type zinc finger protein [Nitrososphaeraceae archaeon]|jgi:uncharacterized C2H2 Zn-finger protein|nr:C2H2-type zinc finger protein [Nitrososphaeraceae archaeon]
MYTKQITMSSSENKNKYKCEECGMVFSSQQELQQHANEEHVAAP